MSASWKIRLGRQAERDFVEILNWTVKFFGKAQAKTYSSTILRALRALKSGPDIQGVRLRDEIAVGIRTLHVARLGRKGRHFIVFRVSDNEVIDILRLLHDSMELVRHLPAANDALV